jgi:hypothetical protein
MRAQEFMSVVVTDLPKLVAWKNSATPFFE